MGYIGVFFFNDTAPSEIYTALHSLSLRDALPLCLASLHRLDPFAEVIDSLAGGRGDQMCLAHRIGREIACCVDNQMVPLPRRQDRKSTRLNSSHYCASRMPSVVCKKNQAQRTACHRLGAHRSIPTTYYTQ